MSREDAVRSLLLLAFLGVLAAGAALTIRNYRSWNKASSAIAVEYKKNTEAGEGTSENTVYYEAVSGDTGRDDSHIPDGEIWPDTAGEDAGSGNNGPETDGLADNTSAEADRELPENTTDDTENRQPGENDGQGAETMEKDGFYIAEISDELFARMSGKSYPEGCTVPREELRYVHIRHYGFEGEILDGELVVNASIAQDVLEIFEELYAIQYRIEKVRLIDEYDADDERSMEDNNSSCFNYRTIAETSTLSNHAYGLAIDINPYYNPYYYVREDGTVFLQPVTSERYLDRTIDAACIITNGDECYNIFIAHGFKWGGDWIKQKDYQHFEKVN